MRISTVKKKGNKERTLPLNGQIWNMPSYTSTTNNILSLKDKINGQILFANDLYCICKEKCNSGSAYYHAVQNPLSFRLESKNVED
jgi:hypothetical protein